ncbi:NAD(P)/FAD-dependent oxidoreductase [Lacibacter luteus]|uniref:NAD(P)/FAD-dependent oxidoreductase n=1 Tax=Lacibacter luteus TaxID=2508719 RepID=A0A4Q1CDY1_9BACT|nr:NAD(P)/FAD-dependent oxidoreductase [Lacibacter luteus]RXK57613.1 NAD(P)/FAD-dependent oxidoreductase [Lacibacter luteus]
MAEEKKQKCLVVIGGGAAGFFCAVNAARMNPLLHVIILEKSSKVLSKVKVSGGGRCNVTHACFDVQELSKRYPRGEHFVRKAFHQFFTKDTIEWFQERGVELKEEADGRMFPFTDSSQTIIDCLLREVNKYKVELLLNREVKNVEVKSEKWEVELNNSHIITADYVCVASGGFPKLEQFDWLKGTGHSIVAPVPSLFTFNMPKHPITELMGVVVQDATVKIQNSKLKNTGPLLITHWGMSGPCILKLSAWGARELHDRNYEFTIHINWLNERKEQDVKDELQLIRNSKGSQKIANNNLFQLPNRLWTFLLQEAGVKEEGRWADLPSKEQNKLVQLLCNHEFHVKGKTTFKEEFVTAGGVDLKQVDANAMQSKLHPNLFFAGEILDVDGITGGFNFQHAWTSGFIAAKTIAQQ